MSITNTLFAKTAVALVAAAMLFSLAFVPAQAQTSEELQQQINDLLATIATLQAQLAGTTGGTVAAAAVCPFTWTRSLSNGDSGADVMALQKFLNSDPDTRVAATGVGSAGQETDYFGGLTGAAVAKFQSKYRADILTPLGLVNATQFFGPSTMAKANMLCTSAPTTPTTPTTPTDPTTPTVDPTNGTEGSVNVTQNSSPSNGTDLEKGETEVVSSFDVEAEDSDMTVSRVDINFNKRPWLYLSSIRLIANGQVIAEVNNLDSDDFTEVTSGSDYRLRLTGINYVIPEDEEHEFEVEVTALTSTDKSATTITVTHKIDSVRAVDTKGLNQEEPTTAFSRTFDFEDNTAGNVVATIDSDTPDERNVAVSDTSDTEGVELMRFNIEAENQDIEVNELRFTVQTTGQHDPTNIFDDIWLADSNGNKIASADTLATTTVFLDLDEDEFTIAQDDENTYRLMGDVHETDSLPISGATLTAGVGASTTLTANTTNVVAEDSDFDTATVDAKTVTGEDVYFHEAFAEISNTSADADSVVDNAYLADLTVEFTITAEGDDIFVSKTPSTFVSTSTTASSAELSAIDAGDAEAGDTATAYIISEDDSRTFKLTGSMNNLNGTTGNKNFSITAINWGTTSGAPAAQSTTFGLEDLDDDITLTAT